MKDISVEDSQDISQNCRRHVSGITLLKEERKDIIDTNICPIPKNGIPNADKDKTDLCLG